MAAGIASQITNGTPETWDGNREEG